MTKTQDTIVRVIMSILITFQLPVLAVLLGGPWWAALVMLPFGAVNNFAYWMLHK